MEEYKRKAIYQNQIAAYWNKTQQSKHYSNVYDM